MGVDEAIEKGYAVVFYNTTYIVDTLVIESTIVFYGTAHVEDVLVLEGAIDLYLNSARGDIGGDGGLAHDGGGGGKGLVVDGGGSCSYDDGSLVDVGDHQRECPCFQLNEVEDISVDDSNGMLECCLFDPSPELDDCIFPFVKAATQLLICEVMKRMTLN